MKNFFAAIAGFLPIVLCFYTVEVEAQAKYFLQSNNQPIFLNPSFVGNEIDVYRIGLNYQNQVYKFPSGNPRLTATFDMPLMTCKNANAHFGVGGLVSRNRSRYSSFIENETALSFAYHRSIDGWWGLSIGAELGYHYKKLKEEEARALQFPDNDFDYLNTTLGISGFVYVNEKSRLQIGGSYNHFFEPESVLKEYIYLRFEGLWTAHLNGKIGIGKHFSFNPSMLYIQQDNRDSALVGGSFGYHFQGNSNTEWSDAIYIGCQHQSEDGIPNIVLGADLGKFSLNVAYESIDYDEELHFSLIYRGLTKYCN